MSDNNNRFVHNIMGQGRLNQLGGMYINGRPLPHHVRVQIVEMSKRNVKPCEISRELQVSHGAVSKILNRYAETGNILPGAIGSNPRQRLSIQSVEKQIAHMKEERPEITAQEIQQCLVDHGCCTRINVPSVSSINRHLKARGLVMKRGGTGPKTDLVEPPPPNAELWLNLSAVKEPSPKTDNKKPKFSIDNILNMVGQNNSEQKAACSSSDERSESESSTPIGRSRTYFTPEQVELLEKAYDSNPYPDQNEKERIALKSGLNENKVQVWFSNRRARQRKNLTGQGFYEYQLRSVAAIQQPPQFVPQIKNETIVDPTSLQPNAIPQSTNSFLSPQQYLSFAQSPMSLWNYLQQQQLMQIISAFQQQNQSTKCIP